MRARITGGIAPFCYIWVEKGEVVSVQPLGKQDYAHNELYAVVYRGQNLTMPAYQLDILDDDDPTPTSGKADIHLFRLPADVPVDFSPVLLATELLLLLEDVKDDGERARIIWDAISGGQPVESIVKDEMSGHEADGAVFTAVSAYFLNNELFRKGSPQIALYGKTILSWMFLHAKNVLGKERLRDDTLEDYKGYTPVLQL